LCDGVAWALRELAASTPDNAGALASYIFAAVASSGDSDLDLGWGSVELGHNQAVVPSASNSALPVQDPLRTLLWYSLGAGDIKLWKQLLDLGRTLQAESIIRLLEYAIQNTKADIWDDIFHAFCARYPLKAYRVLNAAAPKPDANGASALATRWYPDCNIPESSLKNLGFEGLKRRSVLNLTHTRDWALSCLIASLDTYLERWRGYYEVQLQVLDLLDRPSLVKSILVKSWVQDQCDKNLPHYYRLEGGLRKNSVEAIVKMASKSTRGLKMLKEV
jgi:hypothetical protein